jgi:hypothetical protein
MSERMLDMIEKLTVENRLLQDKNVALQNKNVALEKSMMTLRLEVANRVPKRKKQTRSDETRAKMSLASKERGSLGTLAARIALAEKAGNLEKVALLQAEKDILKREAERIAYREGYEQQKSTARGFKIDVKTTARKAKMAEDYADEIGVGEKIPLEEVQALAKALAGHPLLQELNTLMDGSNQSVWFMGFANVMNPKFDDEPDVQETKRQGDATFRAIQQRAKEAGLL